MEKVNIDELILSLEKWEKICSDLNIKNDSKIVKNTINVLKKIKVKTLEEAINNVENTMSNENTKVCGRKGKYNFNDILSDYYSEADLEKKYKFKLIKTKGEDIKKLWERYTDKKAITVKELSVIYCILTNSNVEIKKKNKKDFIDLLNNVVSNINRDKALENIIV